MHVSKIMIFFYFRGRGVELKKNNSHKLTSKLQYHPTTPWFGLTILTRTRHRLDSSPVSRGLRWLFVLHASAQSGRRLSSTEIEFISKILLSAEPTTREE